VDCATSRSLPIPVAGFLLSPPEVTSPFIVEVLDGVQVSIAYAETGAEVETEFFNASKTIDKLFGVVEDAIKRQTDEISVTYDSRFGYPTHIRIDYLKEAVDEEIAYKASEFKLLTGLCNREFIAMPILL